MKFFSRAKDETPTPHGHRSRVFKRGGMWHTKCYSCPWGAGTNVSNGGFEWLIKSAEKHYHNP